MANHMKRCSCRQCRAGLHTKAGGEVARQAVRKARRLARVSLKNGETPSPVFSVDYTD
jgi:hypothetical protein